MEKFFIKTKYWKKDIKVTAAFTLIELLVVVAVIGVLASGALVLFQQTRAKSHDSKRLSEIKALQDALALYQIQYANFPVQPEEEVVNGNDTMTQALMKSGALKAPILDPINGSRGVINYVYTYQSTELGDYYVIRYCLETGYYQGRQKGCGNEANP